MKLHRLLLSLAGLFAAISLSASAQAPTLPPPPAATTVTASGATATTIAQVAGATQVSTATVSGGNGYNAFSAFQVAPGGTVNLLVPAAASNNNLLNLVSGSQTQIFGTVNSLLSSGAIGGNIFFADAQGIVIGAGGVLNVGSLTLAAPSADFVNNFFTDVTGNTAALLAGTEPLDPNGLIAVAGQVHSAGPTTLAATSDYVSGGITTGTAQFSSLVDTTGLQTGQTISISGNTILIDGGAGAAAALAAGSGDVDLTANPSDSEAVANAVAAITLGNASLSGNNINIKATATASSEDSFGSEFTNLADTSSFPFNVLGLANLNSATANASINLGGGAGATTLTASGNVTIAAEADPSVSVITLAPVGDISFGSTSATAVANLASNASITAGGSVALGTLINNKLYLNPSAVGTGTPSASVSYGNASSNSTTTLAGTVTGSNIGITADNENSFSTGAGAAAADNGIAGIGVALGFYSSQANATLSGSATATGADTTANGATTAALNLLATSNNNTDNLSSSSSVSDDTSVSTVTQSATGGLAFVGDLADFLGKLGKSDESSDSDPSPLALSAAVSYGNSSNAATALVTGNATAQTGSATIASSAQDTPQANANGTAGGAKASIGGGVAISNFSNTATTTVSGAVSGNQGVSITANATLPNPFSLSAFTSLPGEFDNFQFVAPSSITDGSAYQQDWNAAETLGGDIVNVLNPNNSNGIGQFVNSNLGLNNVVTSFVNTGASAEGGQGGGSSFGLAGSVNIMGLTNQANAVVASGAQVDAANHGVNVNAEADSYLINVVGMAADLGQLKDKNPGASGDAALGGSYDGITLTNGGTAAVDDGALVTAENGGDINVNGGTDNTLINITQAGDNAGKFGVNGTFAWITLNNSALGYIQSNATVNAAGDVNVGASDNLFDVTVGGALGYGGNAQVGATVDWNQFTNTTEAYIGDPGDSRTSGSGSVTAGGSVNVNANGNEALWNISLAAELATGQSQNDDGNADTSEGGGETSASEGTGSGGEGSGEEGFGLGVSGNVSINDITDTTQAFINNAATVLAGNQISLQATDTSWAVSAGLAAALASGGDSGVDLAGAFARNDFSKDTEATAENALLAGLVVNGQPGAAAGISLTAQSSGDLLTIAAGGGISTGEGLSLAGSANNNVLTNTTKAGLGAGAVADASGNISINAQQADKVLSIAGALAYSGSFGLGAALDLSTYTNTTDAYIGDGAQVNAGANLQLTASTDEKILPIAAALGTSDEVALGGAVVKDEISNDTEATIGKATVNAGGNLLLGADDPSQLLLIAGSLGGSGTAGIGVAGAISLQDQPLLSRTVKAEIADGAQVSAAGNGGDAISYMGQNVDGLLLDATAEGNADTIVAGVGVAGDAGIAASLALNYFNEDVEANIDSGASVNPNGPGNNKQQTVAANANDNTQILDVAGEIAGAGTVAIGAAADVQTLTRTVQASLGGSINAAGNISANATLGGTDWSVAGAASLAGTVDLAGAASAIFDTSTITADVAPGANIYSLDNVLVDAEHSNTLNTIDGELGFSAEVGVGGALSLVEQGDTTKAYVGAGATVTALANGPGLNTWVNLGDQPQQGQVNGLAVVANADDNLLTIAAGGQVTTGVSVAGSVVLNNINETTQAYIDQNASINPASTQGLASTRQAVDVFANDGTTLTAGVGALAAGIDIYGVGIGAAINLEGPLSQLPSAASSFSSSLSNDLNGGSDPNPVSPSGFTKLTTAGVNNGASVNALGGLDISAFSTEDLTNYLGSIAAGIVGVAGTVELDDYTPTTTAYFGNCAVSSSCAQSSGATANVGSAAIYANDTFEYNAVVGEATLGGVGLGAAVLDSTVDATTSAFEGAFSDLETNKGAQIGSDFNDTFDAAALAGGVAAIAVNVPYAVITDGSTNAAFVANNATLAGGNGDVTLEASSLRTVESVVAAAELSALGAAAEIETVNFNGSNTASIGAGDSVTSNGSINLTATLADSVPEYLPANFARIPSISADSIPTGVLGAAIGALAGTGGQVTLNENADDSTSIGNSTVTAAKSVSLHTNDAPSLYAASAGLDGGVLGAGASLSYINLNGHASLGLAGTVTATNGSLQATSQLIENLTGSATGIGGGLADGNGTVANINDNETNSLTQNGTTSAGGDASLEANTNRTANATSGSTSYGLLAVGVSFADVGLAGSTKATINGAVNAGSGNTATVQAYDNDNATISAVVNAAGAGNGIGAMAGSPDGFSADPSLINPQVEATIASGASLNAGTINVFTDDSSNLNSTANGGLIGALNVGLLDAEGKVNPGLTLEMAGSLTGGTITVQSNSSQTVISDAQSSESSSLLSGYSTSDGAYASPDIHLYLDGSVNASGNALVESDSSNNVSATATAIAQDDIDGTNFSLLAGGYTTSTASINNDNLIYLYGTVASSGGNSSFNASSSNLITQNNATGGTGSGVATGADTTANTYLTDSTHANLAGTLNAVNGTATQLASGTEEAYANAGDDTSGASGLSYIESTSYTSVDADIADNVDASAVVNATTYNLTATMPSLFAGSSATGIAEPGLHGDGDANSTLNLTLDPTIHVLGGAVITAAAINILANDGNSAPGAPFGDIFATADPTAGTHSATGSANASDTLNVYVNPSVTMDSGSILNTDALSVEALYPLTEAIGAGPQVAGVSTITYVTEQVEETVNEVVGWIPIIGDLVKAVTKWVTETIEEITDSTVSINNYGARVNPGGNVTVNSTINQLNAVGAANLTIGADGQAEPGSNGLSIQSEDGSNVVLNSLVNDATGLSITLVAEGGTVAGSPVINIENMPPAINITNDSNLNLVMQQLSPIGNGGGQVPFTIEADNDDLNPTFIDNQTPTAITIANNGAGSVVFTNTIADQPGSLTVVNAGGSILSSLLGQIDVNQLSLDAPHGSIGSPGSLSCAICPGNFLGNLVLGPLSVQPDAVALTQNSAPIAPTVAAVAGGDIDMSLTPFESVPGELITAAPSVNLTNLLAGGNINLNLNPAQVQGVELQTITYQTIFGPLSFQFPVPVNGPAANTIYNVGGGQWLAAGGNLNLGMGGGSGSQVTLNDNGLVASGFQNIQFNIDPAGNPISVVTADGQTNSSLLDYLQNFGGAPVLANLNASSGGQISLNGSGAVSGNGVLGVLQGFSGVQVNNADSHPGLLVQNISDAGVANSSIQVFGAGQALSGTLAGSGVTLATYGDNSGNLDLESAGNLSLAGQLIFPAGSVALQAQQTLDTSAGLILAGTLANLNTPGNANLGFIQVTNGDVVAQAGGNLTDNSLITASGNASLTGNQGLTLNQLIADGDANLNGGQGDLLANLLTIGGNANLQAEGAVNVNSLSSGGDATLNAGQNLDLGSAVVGGNAQLNAGQELSVTNALSVGGAATLDAGQDINYTGPISAGGNASLNARGGSIIGQNLVAGGNASLVAQANIQVEAVTAAANAILSAGLDIDLGSVVALGGNASLTANAGAINAANGNISAGGNALLTAAQDIDLGTVSAGGDANLRSNLGNINLGLDPGSITAGGDATLWAALDINAPTGSISAGHDANLTAGGNILLGTVTAGNDANLAAIQNITLGSVTAAADANLGTVVGDINLGTVMAGNDANLSAGGNINAANGSVTAGADANLTAALTITLGTVQAQTGNATLTATAGDINLGTVRAGTDANLTAGGNINGPGGVITAGQDATLLAGNSITLGTLTAGNNATLTAAAGDINLGSVAAGNDATLGAGNNINAAAGTITAGQDAALTAGNDITLGTLTAGNNATLTASDDINVGPAGSVTAGNTASLTTLVNDINLLGTVTAPTALLTANRNISGGGTVIANVTQLAAETGAIGTTGDDLNLELDTIDGATPTLSVASRGDSNLNVTAMDPPAPGSNTGQDQEPVGNDPTLYGDIISMLVGGNLNMNLNPGFVIQPDGSTLAENAWYEIPTHDAAIVAGDININETAANRDYDGVTLDVDGLLASGFQDLTYTVSPTGAWSTTVTDAGQTVTGLVNLATIANGVINLSDINAAQGGVINLTGTGQLANPNHLFASGGPSSVTVNNQDPNLLLQTNNITLGFGQGDIDLARQTWSGSGIAIDWADGGWGWGWGWGGGNNWDNWDWDNGQPDGDGLPRLSLTSANGITLAGTINNRFGVTHITASGDINGAGLTESRILDLNSLNGAIGAPGSALTIAIGDLDGDIDGIVNASAANGITLAAPTTDLPVGTITTAGDINLSTAGSILNALGDNDHDGHGSWDSSWGGPWDGDQPPANNLSGNNITLDAGHSIGDDPLVGTASGAWSLSAGTGINLVSNGDFNASSVATQHGNLQLEVNGNASIATLSAPSAELELNQPGATLTVGEADIASWLDADADNLLINLLRHTDSTDPLTLYLAGAHDDMAQSIAVNVVSASPVQLSQYASETGSVSVAGAWLDVDNALIGQSAAFSNSWLAVALTNVDRRGRPQTANLDMVGNRDNLQGGNLSSATTALQPGVFTLPSPLTPAEQSMVRELGHH